MPRDRGVADWRRNGNNLLDVHNVGRENS